MSEMAENLAVSNLHSSLLEVRDLCVDFRMGDNYRTILSRVSWSIAEGETVAIIGESGSGKSMTASAIMGLLDVPPARITSGQVIFQGTDVLRASEEQRRAINGSKIAIVFQDTLAGLNPVMAIGEQIAEAIRIDGVSRHHARENTVDLLEHVGIKNAEQRYNYYPHQFSGGQRQRIMIAMAIARKPSLLVADEPTSALDVTVQANIITLLKRLQAERKMAMVFITHNMHLARDIADRIVVMRKGEVVEVGTADAVIGNPQHEYTKMLVASVPGQAALTVRPANPCGLLKVEGLNKTYRGQFSWGRRGSDVRALKDVSFNLNEDETVCIVGESGSGKSTLVRSILGLERLDSGSISYLGRQVNSKGLVDVRAFKSEVQPVFQDPVSSLNPFMKVRDIILEPLGSTALKLRVVGDNNDTTIGELLDRVGLPADSATRLPHQFSGGQCQRIAIARALAPRPRVLICDEAVSALDVSVQARILALFRALQEEYRLSIIFVTHDLAVVRDVADRVLVMLEGEVVESGTREQIFERPQHAYTRKLLQSQFGASPHRFDK